MARMPKLLKVDAGPCPRGRRNCLNSEETTARALRDLEIELTAELEHFRALAARNRLRAQRQREKAMIERERQKRRAVELRAGGRSGVRIAARMGIGLRTLYDKLKVYDL